MSRFKLDAELAKDFVVVGDFTICRLLLMNDSQYPWFILVPRIQGAEEIYQLDEAISGVMKRLKEGIVDMPSFQWARSDNMR